MNRLAVLPLIAAIAFAVPAHAGDLSGTVYDGSGRPAAEVQLSVPELGLETLTSADGTYRFEGLAAGEHEIAIGLGGDNVQFASASVPEEGVAQRNIVLFSRASVERAINSETGVDPVKAEAAFEDALELAERMLDEGSAARDGLAWRWNDLEG